MPLSLSIIDIMGVLLGIDFRSAWLTIQDKFTAWRSLGDQWRDI